MQGLAAAPHFKKCKPSYETQAIFLLEARSISAVAVGIDHMPTVIKLADASLQFRD